MSKILLTLDNPSDIITNNPDIAEEFYYAVVADDIKDLDEEGVLVMLFCTKEDYEKGQGTLTYITPCMYENIFEYTAKLI